MLQALANELAKDLKTPQDLSKLVSQLTKMSVEAALQGELTHHLGYEKHDVSGHGTGNSRNGSTTKQVKGSHGEFELTVPRDREGSFEPQLVRKGQRRITGMDDQILALYANGLSTRDIVSAFKSMYDVDVSATLISQVTDSVMERVREWQQRPLDAVYPIVYLDGIVLKIRQDSRVINKTLHVALGVNLDGKKELLGLWLAENEGAKFWLSVLTELQQRGVEQVCIACVDGLSGFPDAIAAAYPQAKVQLCIVHMIRNSLRYVSWKDSKAVTRGLKTIYQASTEALAQEALEAFATNWDEKYPQISKSWRRHWPNLITLFDYPEDIRRAIYTTNAVESLNSVIRKAVKNRKVFPTDEAALKVVYLAMQQAAKKWTMPIKNWRLAMTRFMIEFEEQLAPYVK
jgi:transposase-like protein